MSVHEQVKTADDIQCRNNAGAVRLTCRECNIDVH